jgi:L-rhamnose isomerase/sugar isomerase
MQAAFAKALLVDRAALQSAQEQGDIVSANEVLSDAYETDVRPMLGELRSRLGVPLNPLETFQTSEERQRRLTDRVGVPAGW